jgi:hypothetical protein
MAYEVGSLKNESGKTNMHLDSIVCLLEQHVMSGSDLENAIEKFNSANIEYFVTLPIPDGEASPGLEKADPKVNDYKYMFMAAAKDKHVVVLKPAGITLYRLNIKTKITKLEDGVKNRLIDNARVVDESLYKDALVYFGIDLINTRPVVVVNKSEHKLIENEKEVTREDYKTEKPFEWPAKK